MRIFLELSATTAALLSSATAAAQAVNATAPTDDIIVTGARAGQTQLNESASATGLDLTLRETPQSVTVIDRQRIEDFALTNINDLLDQAVGVQVNRNETDRTNYYARGFEITNQQVDGIGLPLLGAIDGDLDTILYERIDVTRGANAIQNGIGNPSATINYLRKRPTRDYHVDAAAYAGSFDNWRLEGDVSAPLTTNGTVRARAIVAHEERDSWLDYSRVNRDVAAGLIAWDVTPDVTATAGYSRQSNRADGILWGALPLVFNDGTRIPYRRSDSTAAPWTYVDTVNESSFGELAWHPDGDWALRGIFTYNDQRVDARRLYATGTPDPDTGLGLVGYSGLYPTRKKQYLLDGYAAGSVDLFGRQHQVAFGISTGWLRSREFEASTADEILYGDVRKLGTGFPPLPSYPAIAEQGRERDRLTRVYGAAHLVFTDRLKAVVGASAFWLKTTGTSYGTDLARRNDKVSPYAGLLYDVTANVTLYASYTDIYNPQSQVDVSNRRLDPAAGTSIEAGVKGSWLGNRLYATAAVFRAKQKGLATYVCTFNTDGCAAGPALIDYYEGVDTTATGVEAEVSARVTGRWSLNGGITHLRIRDEAGAPTILFYPRNSIKLGATYQVPEWRDLKLGGQVRYQSRIRAEDDTGAGFPIEQGSYAVLDLLGEVRIVDRVKASLNVRNVTNRRYLNSLEWGQAYYAAPRSVLGTVRFEL